MAGHPELARAKWVSHLVATDDVIRSVLLDADPEKVDAVFRSAEIKKLLSQLLEVSTTTSAAPEKKKTRRGGRRDRKSALPVKKKKRKSGGIKKKKKLRKSAKKKAQSSGVSNAVENYATTTSGGNGDATHGSPKPAVQVGAPKRRAKSDLGFMSSDDEIIEDGDHQDLEKTVYWNELNHPFGPTSPGGLSDSGSGSGGNSRTSSNGTPISAASGGGGGQISDQDSSPLGNESPRGRRVSFAEDVWVQEIPKVDKSMIKDLFYSEADIDDMYQEAEDEVLNATVPMTANGTGSGGEFGSEKGGSGFNSTI